MNESTSNKECKSCCSICWGSAIVAGLVATIIMTVVMYFEGINITKMLGMMLMGSDAGIGSQYAAGGVLHFAVGIFYGIVYAAVFAPLKMCTLFKAFIFGIIITGIAFFGMPIMANMLAEDGAANPCNPCSMSSSGHYNPCNPCAMHEAANPCATHKGMNPCNPCSMSSSGHYNPCNPCAMHEAANPCAMHKGMNPCNPCSMSSSGHYNPCNPCAMHEAANPCAMHKGMNPCNPCAMLVVEEVDVVVVNPCALEHEEEKIAWEVLMISFFNHFVFAFSLAFLYKMRKNKKG